MYVAEKEISNKNYNKSLETIIQTIHYTYNQELVRFMKNINENLFQTLPALSCRKKKYYSTGSDERENGLPLLEAEVEIINLRFLV